MSLEVGTLKYMLDQLPDEISLEVLQWVPKSDLIKNCLFVNKKISKVSETHLALQRYKELSNKPSQLAKFLLNGKGEKTFQAYYQFIFSQNTDFSSLLNFCLSNITAHFSEQTSLDKNYNKVWERQKYLKNDRPNTLEKNFLNLIQLAKTLKTLSTNDGDKIYYPMLNRETKIKLGYFLDHAQRIEETVVLLGLFELLNTQLNVRSKISMDDIKNIVLVSSLTPAISRNTLLALQSWMGDLFTTLQKIANTDTNSLANTLLDKLTAEDYSCNELSDPTSFIHQNIHLVL